MSLAPDPADIEARRLLDRYLAGDSDAFGQLARSQYSRLWPVALRVSGGDPEEAADGLQDGMIAAMRGAAGFRGDAKVSTWMHRIVVNACLDRHRRRQRHPTSPYPVEEQVIADDRDRIGEREVAWEVERALAGLPFDQRAAVVLVDVEGWSVAEAAVLLDIPAGTVKSRCSRGRARLAIALAHLRNREGGGDVVDGVAHRGTGLTGGEA